MSDDVHAAGEADRSSEAAGMQQGAEAAGPALPNLAVRVFQVVVSPSRLFDGLRTQPRWLGALLLVVGIALVTSFLIPSDIITESVRQQMLRAQPDAAPEAIERGMAVARIFRFAGPLVFMPIIMVVISAVLFLVYEMGMGGEAGFRSVLASTSHAFLIPSLGSLVTLPVVIKARNLQASLSLDLLAPGFDQGSYAYRFLHGMGIFGVWGAIVLGLGMSRIYPKRSTGGSIALVLGLYVAFKAITAIFAR
jgi:hypothetical protein